MIDDTKQGGARRASLGRGLSALFGEATEDYSAAQVVRLAKLMPLDALPTPAQIADAVVYLAQAQHVTGQIIFVDGGAHLKSFDRDFMHL